LTYSPEELLALEEIYRLLPPDEFTEEELADFERRLESDLNRHDKDNHCTG
jgi:hypothetical protein